MLLEKFLSYIEKEKQYSELTISSYRRDIGQFLLFIESKSEDTDGDDIFDAILYSDIREYMVFLSNRKLNRNTINRKVSAISSLFSYLNRNGYISSDPTQNVTLLKKSRVLPKFIEESLMNKIIKSLLLDSDDYLVLRDNLIILILYATGLRVSELISLRESSFSKDLSEIKVLGKGGKDRLVPISPVIVGLIKKMINILSEICKSENNYLFLSKHYKPIDRSVVYRIVDARLLEFGVEGKRSPHVLRHTFATHMLNNGAGIETVKELLGHKTLATTQIYTHNNIEQLKKSYMSAHPRGVNNVKKS